MLLQRLFLPKIKKSKKIFDCKKGVTIPELLLVMTLIALAMMPIYNYYTKARAKRALESSAERLVSEIRSAHMFARDARYESHWGIVKDAGDDNYYLRYGDDGIWTDEKRYSLEPNVNFETESFFIKFSIGTGQPDPLIETNLILENQYDQQAVITITPTGVVDLEYNL